MKTRGLSMALGGSLLAAIAASPAQSEEYAANIFFGPELTLTKYAYTEFAKRVADATNGAVSFKVYTGGVLIPPRASMEGIADGIAQVGYHAGTYTPDKIPRHNLISELSFVSTDYFVTALASTEISFVMPELEAEWKANGVVYGGGYSTLPYVLQCNTKLETLADVKGKRLRMPGAIWDRWATAMGAVSVNVPSSEIYTGLDRGTIDCGVNPAEGLKSRSFWDVANHVLDLPLGVYYSGFHWAYNPDFWGSLSVEQRKTLYEQMAWAIAKTGVEYTRETEAVIAQAKAEKGVTFVQPAPDLLAAHAAFVEQDSKALVELAKTKYGIDDAQKYIDKYMELVAKWEGLLKNVDKTDVDAIKALVMSEIYDKVDPATYGL
ncbi:C4-dicarboxylate TRAP transporter substrate-binding protein [Futiania mangrovi]|uniref:C4-dicarboxylate TRAP transporter substrate-binding protein n=1 Tax=Futiania mangrovi TaxID=2959716 RepID=A0A9J6PM19_9PROT|nr:C4-dicarboxylate TRAP transporter substrate-binding protein [Futiania mangrovii]MCP1337090.1 C4-dicarboxylate TRAP transporter substrate-binding protein [Futiania mangrovii]